MMPPLNLIGDCSTSSTFLQLHEKTRPDYGDLPMKKRRAGNGNRTRISIAITGPFHR
jgi:hypothetical protein